MAAKKKKKEETAATETDAKVDNKNPEEAQKTSTAKMPVWVR